MTSPARPVGGAVFSHELPRTPVDAATVAARAGKIRMATISLCGCWGCTLSILDMDERILPLLEKVTITRSSLTDIKRITERCTVGFVEGGVANEENIETLAHFRENCDLLIAVGACALWGGVPALRNAAGLEACLREAYVDSPTRPAGSLPIIPLDEDIPRLTTTVRPCHEVVRIDYVIPGCPPDGDQVFSVLDDLVNGRPVDLPTAITRFD
jgi:NAD-reducing hydrogenase small subunit